MIVTGTAIVKAVSTVAPVCITRAHPIIAPKFIFAPETAPTAIIPSVIISICAPTSNPVLRSPRKSPTNVQVISGLSKFVRPKIRESNWEATAIKLMIKH